MKPRLIIWGQMGGSGYRRMLNKYRLDAEIAHDIFIVDIVSADTYLLTRNTMWGISTHIPE
jgi:hypothetical protein